MVVEKFGLEGTGPTADLPVSLYGVCITVWKEESLVIPGPNGGLSRGISNQALLLEAQRLRPRTYPLCHYVP